MNDSQFSEKAKEIFKENNCHAVICNDGTTLLIDDYLTRERLVKISVDIIKLEANTRNKLIRELKKHSQ